MNEKGYNERKLVSTVITTHNRSPIFVMRAINSVLKQTYDKIELIVVDDSDDNFPLRYSVERAVYQASDKILYIKHTTSLGACAARNTGLSFSKGYYVAFLDDDDEWLPEKIEEQIKGFTDSSIALVYCGYIKIDEFIKKEYIVSMTYKSGSIFMPLLYYNWIGNSSNPLIKKSCLDEVGNFDTKMQSAQDYDLWLRIAMRYPVNHIKKVLLNYYIHDNDRISIDLDKQIAGQERINAKYYKFINNNNKTWYMRHMILIPLYVKKGWKKKAYSLWYECVKKSPLDIKNNLKLLMIIIYGFDSLLFKFYYRLRKAFI